MVDLYKEVPYIFAFLFSNILSIVCSYHFIPVGNPYMLHIT